MKATWRMDVAKAYALLLRVDNGDAVHGQQCAALLERGLVERVLARVDGRLRWSYELTRDGRALVALVNAGLNYSVGVLRHAAA